jgi:thymidylate synthase (FAD)|tara:strand:+ start:1771 stop:2481 length:711 start_codon:yes stop_codon:yes gene_type:complete
VGQLENTVELLGYYGSDETIACSAWTSTSRELTDGKRERIPKLINMLWRDGHQTPFEKGMVHFLVNTDIATHIQIAKHRISSMNAESARYKELKEDKYYLPEDWDGININLDWDNVKDEHGFHLGVPFKCAEIKDWNDMLGWYTRLGNFLYHSAVKDLEPVLGRKRAKESARFFKTYNSQIQGDVSFNMRSFANFQKLRNSDHSQLEIRNVAQQMLTLVENIEGNPFEHTLEAFNG